MNKKLCFLWFKLVLHCRRQEFKKRKKILWHNQRARKWEREKLKPWKYTYQLPAVESSVPFIRFIILHSYFILLSHSIFHYSCSHAVWLGCFWGMKNTTTRCVLWHFFIRDKHLFFASLSLWILSNFKKNGRGRSNICNA